MSLHGEGVVWLGQRGWLGFTDPVFYKLREQGQATDCEYIQGPVCTKPTHTLVAKASPTVKVNKSRTGKVSKRERGAAKSPTKDRG